jgi:hypothetical protein
MREAWASVRILRPFPDVVGSRKRVSRTSGSCCRIFGTRDRDQEGVSLGVDSTSACRAKPSGRHSRSSVVQMDNTPT